jgi:trimeric autotransporter adhesin
MNKTYRSVWNDATGTWVAASELATGRKKSSRSAKIATVIVGIGAVAGLLPETSFAGAYFCNPAGGVTAGTQVDYTGVKSIAIGNCQAGNYSGSSGGVILDEAGNSWPVAGQAALYVGATASSGVGTVKLVGPNGISFQGATTTTGHLAVRCAPDH